MVYKNKTTKICNMSCSTDMWSCALHLHLTWTKKGWITNYCFPPNHRDSTAGINRNRISEISWMQFSSHADSFHTALFSYLLLLFVFLLTFLSGSIWLCFTLPLSLSPPSAPMSLFLLNLSQFSPTSPSTGITPCITPITPCGLTQKRL